MRSPLRFPASALAAIALWAGAATSLAGSLLLDFGQTPAATGADALLSPGHAAGTVSSAETTWNLVGSTDIASGLFYSDGTAANGVSINLGSALAGGGAQTIDFAAANTIDASNMTGAAGPTLGIVYSGNAPARDGIFNTNGLNPIGLRIDGLTAGTYVLYFVGRNSNANTVRPDAFWATAGAFSTSFDYSGLTAMALSNSSMTGNDTFIAGNNFNSVTITVAAGQSVYLATSGTSGAENRGFMNSLEVVAVPEPAIAPLFLGGLLLLARRRRS